MAFADCHAGESQTRQILRSFDTILGWHTSVISLYNHRQRFQNPSLRWQHLQYRETTNLEFSPDTCLGLLRKILPTHPWEPDDITGLQKLARRATLHAEAVLMGLLIVGDDPTLSVCTSHYWCPWVLTINSLKGCQSEGNWGWEKMLRGLFFIAWGWQHTAHILGTRNSHHLLPMGPPAGFTRLGFDFPTGPSASNCQKSNFIRLWTKFWKQFWRRWIHGGPKFHLVILENDYLMVVIGLYPKIIVFYT